MCDFRICWLRLYIIRRYADIAIGAYKSGHVVVLRSKPVVRTNLTIYTVPDTLERNDRNFSIRVCVENRGYNMANIYGKLIAKSLRITIILRIKLCCNGLSKDFT